MKIDKLNVVIGILCVILVVQLYYNNQPETFLSKYDVIVTLKILNALKPRAMKKITFKNLDSHLREIRLLAEMEASQNPEFKKLIDEYNKSTNFKGLLKLYKSRRPTMKPIEIQEIDSEPEIED